MNDDLNFPIEEHGSSKNVKGSHFHYAVFQDEIRELFRIKKNPVAVTKAFLYALGIILTPLTLAGVAAGYVRSYKRFMYPQGELPRLTELPRIVKFSMAVSAILVWAAFILTVNILVALAGPDIAKAWAIFAYLITNTVLSVLTYFVFRRWRVGINNMLMQVDKHASAKYAEPMDLIDYMGGNGLSIGGYMVLRDKGHILTCSNTRGGKGANLIIPNLLGIGGYTGSYFVVDPKGEAAAITAESLRQRGKNVVIINPWDLLSNYIKGKSRYNPLKILSDKSSPHLIDDIGIITEILVPYKNNDENTFFTDSARQMIASLLLHLVTTDTIEKPTLTHLWEWCRLYGQDWDNLIADMAVSKDPIHGLALKNGAREILKQMESPETFSSIISNVLEATSFMKSNALQETLVDDFDPYILPGGNTVVFLIIPVDKLHSQSTFLKLVTITMLRANVRRPGKPVTYVIDEAASMGFISEIPVALAAYGGFNITIWQIFQDLPQIRRIYGADGYETIISNSTVRQFFSIKDNFTVDYVSTAMGDTTKTFFKKDWMGNVLEVENVDRKLATPDEVRRMSKDHMLIFTGENPVARVPKLPYYLNPRLKDVNGKPLYSPNPYIDGFK